MAAHVPREVIVRGRLTWRVAKSASVKLDRNFMLAYERPQGAENEALPMLVHDPTHLQN